METCLGSCKRYFHKVGIQNVGSTFDEEVEVTSKFECEWECLMYKEEAIHTCRGAIYDSETS